MAGLWLRQLMSVEVMIRRQIEVAPAKRRSNVQYSPLDTFRVGQAAGPSDSASKVSIHPSRSRPSGTASNKNVCLTRAFNRD